MDFRMVFDIPGKLELVKRYIVIHQRPWVTVQLLKLHVHISPQLNIEVHTSLSTRALSTVQIVMTSRTWKQNGCLL
jgi:hypothetical protein